MRDDTPGKRAIIATKITRPPQRNVIHRERLYRVLDRGTERKLTIVSAPAGYGKTTLVASWLVDRGLDHLWLSLDRLDESASQIIGYLDALLDVPGPDERKSSANVAAILNRLADRDRDLVVVFDDYHLADTPEIRDILGIILERLPPKVHLVLIARAEPRLKLAKYRGQGELLELREQELRFTFEEADSFLGGLSRLKLRRTELESLVRTTEGWIAGLRMVAAALKDQEQPSLYIQNLSAKNRYLLDYLVEEVLSGLDEGTTEFLLRCSFLDRLQADLCRAVTGRADAQEVLEYLDRNNLFVIPLDDERCWYRLHHLFQDLLRSRLSEARPAELRGLRESAAAWFESRELYVDAIDQLVAAGLTDRAVALMEREAERLMLRGELKAVMRWVSVLPEEAGAGVPFFTFVRAWMALTAGRPTEEIERTMKDLEDGPHADLALCIKAYIAIVKGRGAEALAYSEAAVGSITEPSAFVTGIAALSAALARLGAGDDQEASAALERTAEDSIKSGNLLVAVMALSYRAKIHLDRGELPEAEALYQRAVDLAADEAGRRKWFAGTSLIGLAEVARLRGDASGAVGAYQEGEDILAGWLDFSAVEGELGLARALASLGEYDEAEEALDYADILARNFAATESDDRLVGAYRALLALRRAEDCARRMPRSGTGEGASAARDEAPRGGADRPAATQESIPSRTSSGLLAAERLQPDRSEPASGRGGEPYGTELRARALWILVAARRAMAAGDCAGCAAEAEAVAEGAAGRGYALLALEAELLELRALRRMERMDEVLDLLERVLAFMERSGIVQSAVDEGPELARILYEARTLGLKSPCIGTLLAAFPLEEGCIAAAALPAACADQRLGARELEVLALFERGLSNKEVAARLNISVRTVKWYSSTIYAKLEVKSRTQALAKARLLGVLAD